MIALKMENDKNLSIFLRMFMLLRVFDFFLSSKDSKLKKKSKNIPQFGRAVPTWRKWTMIVTWHSKKPQIVKNDKRMAGKNLMKSARFNEIYWRIYLCRVQWILPIKKILNSSLSIFRHNLGHFCYLVLFVTLYNNEN